MTVPGVMGNGACGIDLATKWNGFRTFGSFQSISRGQRGSVQGRWAFGAERTADAKIKSGGNCFASAGGVDQDGRGQAVLESDCFDCLNL